MSYYVVLCKDGVDREYEKFLFEESAKMAVARADMLSMECAPHKYEKENTD